ncbi:unnamed protein product [Rotaria sp. Silwood1]|nr:unnamed protein product [Rotaria sp. Silwood1]CAF4681898.1 unnamed protein product [Rotaria sp. Silwood1]
MLLINCPMIGLSATVNNGDELRHWIEYIENQRSKLFQTLKTCRRCFIAHHERMADLNKYLYSNLQLHPIHPIGLMNAKQLITRGVPKDFSLSLYETLQLNDVMQNLSTNRKDQIRNAMVIDRHLCNVMYISSHRKENGVDVNSIPMLTQYFEPDWIIERTKYNNYLRLVRNQFHSLIDNKENTIIDSIVTSLKTISSKDIHYPETKPTSFINNY